jgi:hypothetical protein
VVLPTLYISLICCNGFPLILSFTPLNPNQSPGFVNSVIYSDGLYPILFYMASDIAVDQFLCITTLLAVFTT